MIISSDGVDVIICEYALMMVDMIIMIRGNKVHVQSAKRVSRTW